MMKGGWCLPLMRALVILNLREIIRVTGTAVTIKVEVMVEEITAIKVEVWEISLIMQQGEATSYFCKVKRQKGSSDGVESIHQSKVDDSDVKDKEEVCYFFEVTAVNSPRYR